MCSYLVFKFKKSSFLLFCIKFYLIYIIVSKCQKTKYSLHPRKLDLDVLGFKICLKKPDILVLGY